MTDKTLKKKWIEALRSGKYKLIRGRLHRKTNKGNRYCVLGLLCELSEEGEWGSDGLYKIDDVIFPFAALPEPIAEKIFKPVIRTRGPQPNILGYFIDPITEEMTELPLPPPKYTYRERHNYNYRSISEYNDGGASEEQLADALEKYPDYLFKEV